MSGRATTRLTKRAMDQAEPLSRPHFVWDAELRGFGARIDASGAKTFLVRYRPKSMGASAPKRFVTLGRYGALTVEQARNRAREILGAVAAGGDPATEIAHRRSAPLFKEIAEMFLAEHVDTKRKLSTAQDYRSLLLTYAVPILGNQKAQSVTRAQIARLHHELSDKPYQANRLLAVLGSLYAFAERRGLVPENFNPARKIEKYREERRERFLSTDELERLGEVVRESETIGIPWEQDAEKLKSKHMAKEENQRTLLSPHATAALRLLIFTGARLREILHLRWEHVDLERGLLLLPDSKTGRKTIVLNRPALDILKAHPRVGSFVILGEKPGKPRTDLKKPWAAVSHRAGLEGVRLHDLRHTFASIGAGASLGLPIVGKLLGHSQAQTTARYAHLDSDPLLRASNLIGERLERAMAPRSKSNKVISSPD